MLHYEIQELHRAELIREAAEQRRIREAVAGAAARGGRRRRRKDGKGRVNPADTSRYTRAA
ncbi:hypothetical protein [Streptomyces sp. NPDC005805]|uniref:hypothetical protein n=1 Tax=Streptomyces sp. NPDC005805 TaxID=3157068 RepID=UPI0033EC75FB